MNKKIKMKIKNNAQDCLNNKKLAYIVLNNKNKKIV